MKSVLHVLNNIECTENFRDANFGHLSEMQLSKLYGTLEPQILWYRSAMSLFKTLESEILYQMKMYRENQMIQKAAGKKET